jgi:hypothetical protein
MNNIMKKALLAAHFGMSVHCLNLADFNDRSLMR